MTSRANYHGPGAAILCWSVGAAILPGCAALFDIERAQQLDPTEEVAESLEGVGTPSGSGESAAPDGNEQDTNDSGEAAPDESPIAPAESDDGPAPDVPSGPEDEPSSVAEGDTQPEPAEIVLRPADVLPAELGLDVPSTRFQALPARGSRIRFTQEGRLCVEGEAVTLPDKADPTRDDFATSWGASMKVYVDARLGWDPTDFEVAGLSFQLTGKQIPEMRFQAIRSISLPGGGVDQPNFCTELRGNLIAGDETVEVRFSELQKACFGPPPKPEYFEESLIAFEWQVHGIPGNPKSFDFCVDNLQAIPSAAQETPPLTNPQ